MLHELDIHPASAAERSAMHRNTYAFWPRPGATIDEHVELLIHSVQHNRARWYVGSLDGRAVCGLGAHPMEFRVNGLVFPGIGIGSVHTVSECRRRGYAAMLMNWVEKREVELGAAVGLLYSNIPAVYYERLGYRLCPCWRGRRDLNREALDDDAALLTYKSVRPLEARAEIEHLYDVCHQRFPISIHRSPDYWDYVYRKGAADEFGLLHDAEGTLRATVQVAVKGQSAVLVDWAVADPTDATLLMLFRTILREGRRRGWTSLGGWLPDVPAVRSQFDLTAREQELTMLKPLHPDVTLDAAVLLSAQQFRKIDHV